MIYGRSDYIIVKIISKKKQIYPVNNELKEYLIEYSRYSNIQIRYEDLLRYNESISYYDKDGVDTLWYTVFFNGYEQFNINKSLLDTYARLKVDGDSSLMEHLVVDRIDLCSYGNTRPFRVRILNTLNENFDYFYIKKADASRIYGLELEHILSPYRITYFVYKDTLIEEHISGVPGDRFIEDYLKDDHIDKVRITKEFIKFNERCFIRLLGDMHSSNYVVDVTPDFEETIYKIRSIDFDQQCYEGKKRVYLPQYFKQNRAVVKMAFNMMTAESVAQYQHEERALVYRRILSFRDQVEELVDIMTNDEIAPMENVIQLGKELSVYYKNSEFLKCRSMGDLLRQSLRTLNQYDYAKVDIL